MTSTLFTLGGGAGIGSYVVVFENGVIRPDTDFVKVRGAYDAGDSILFSIIDEGASEALIPAAGWVGDENELHLIARDFDDNKTYQVVAEAGAHEPVEAEVEEGIELGDETVPTMEDLAAKADLVDGKVPASQLPSYVDDVVEYASMSEFPEEGEADKIYVDLSTGYTYRWGGTEYVQIGGQDLSDYYTKSETNDLLAAKTSAEEVQAMIDAAIDDALEATY